jgi:hypothetical protein
MPNKRFKRKDRKPAVVNIWKPVNKDQCELEGPYECPFCSGHVMLDATFLDQVGPQCGCPYCNKLVRL